MSFHHVRNESRYAVETPDGIVPASGQASTILRYRDTNISAGICFEGTGYRTVVLDEVRKPSVRTAVAKGLSPAAVLFRHVLRNSLVPVVTNMSLAVPFLFTGSILLESFFGIPGLGGVGLAAVRSADFATLRAVVLLSALFYQLSNLLADVLNAWLDPAVRLA